MKIFITGASSGIGKALAEYLAKRGHKVFGIARRKELLLELQKNLQDNFFFDVCDVEKYSDILKTKKKMENSGFVPEVVILSAAVKLDESAPFDNQSYQKTFSVNVFGAINVVNAFLPDFLKRGKGHFIALSSISAFRPGKNSIAYPASKAALSMTFRGFDLAYRKKGVCFSNIYLGPVDTSMWEGKKSFLVISSKKAAKLISKVIKTKKSNSFMPFFSTFLFRTSRLIPDKIYSKISETVIK